MFYGLDQTLIITLLVNTKKAGDQIDPPEHLFKLLKNFNTALLKHE